MDGNLILKGIILGLGLSMDACTIAMVDGLNDTKMHKTKIFGISIIFGLFQGLMPLIGYSILHALYGFIQKFIPIVSMIILCSIGGKMLYDGIKNNGDNTTIKHLGLATILLQAIATSIDAMSAGFVLAQYSIVQALICSLIISIITFFMCLLGIYLGKKCGTILESKAQLIGGTILCCIGIEMVLTNLL